MGAWYFAGLAVGLATAGGVLLGGGLGRSPTGAVVAAMGAAGAGAALGWLLAEPWVGALAAFAGAIAALAAVQVARGALAGGGTVVGVALLLAAAAAGVAVLALVPFVGFLLALLVPAIAVRGRRRGGARYAGLRILARD